MSALRVGLVHPYLWPQVRRGGERYLDDLATYLHGAGHRVEVLAAGEPVGRLAGSPVATPRLRGYRQRTGRIQAHGGLTEVDLFGLSVYGGLLAHRFDVVHALVPSAALAARLAGQRTVYTLLGRPSREQLEARPAGRWLYRAAVRHADVVTALSEPSAAAARALFGRPARVLPPGVRLDRFPAELAPRTGPPVVLYASDLAVERKGLDVLLAATARLLPARPDLRVVLAGPGEPAWAFERLPAADRSAVAAAVTVAGADSTAELARRYRSATLTALPARDEAFGLVLVESLASGTPVVCCSGSGMSDILSGAAIGRSVPYDDAAALAASIDATIALAAQPGTPAACRHAAARFGWADAVGPAHVELYAELRRSRRLARPAASGSSRTAAAAARTGRVPPDR